MCSAARSTAAGVKRWEGCGDWRSVIILGNTRERKREDYQKHRAVKLGDALILCMREGAKEVG